MATYTDILLVAFSRIPKPELEYAILSALQNPVISPHLRVLRYAPTQHSMLSTYAASLQVAAKNERVSGFFRGSLGCILPPTVNVEEAASILSVSPRSITRALLDAREKLRMRLMTGNHNKFVAKTNYTVDRLPVSQSTITDWILSHCRASANSANVIKEKDQHGNWTFQIRHYRDSTIADLFQEYKTDQPEGVGLSTFYSLVPKCVYLQRYYSGLCPQCSSSHHWEQLVKKKRRQWHDRCTCPCGYCSTCKHGTACEPDCGCMVENCPVEAADIVENWVVPLPTNVLKNDRDKHAPNQMVHVASNGTRQQFLEQSNSATLKAKDHKLHVAWQKTVIKKLKEKLPWNTIMMRWDFLMNYSHVSSIEVGNAFYGRRQSTVLIATVWYHGPDSTPENPVITKTHHAFVSPYLYHTSVVFQKAFTALLPLIDIHEEVTNCIILSDGGMQHFKNRMSMHWGTKVFSTLGLRLRWIIDPAYHGKGECDGRGALLKKKAKIHVLKEDGYLDTPADLANYWNSISGGSSSLLNMTYEDLEEDVETIKGIKACYDFVFSRKPNNLYMRKWPCTCNHCMDFNFGECTENTTVGDWIERKTVVVSVNHPKGIEPVVEQQSGEEFEVEKLVAKRIVKNNVQYLVKWVGYSDEFNDWIYKSELQCDELIELYESTYNK